MPELPEVESARAVIERAALGCAIADVDDSDSYECRPHRPGEIRAVLIGRQLTAVHRRGESLWWGAPGADLSGAPRPVPGVHLPMCRHNAVTVAARRGHDGGEYSAR